MNFYDYITGEGGLILLFRKYKTQRYFKFIEKKEREKENNCDI